MAKELAYEPEHVVRVANPLSQEASRLVTSLVPALMAVVKRNMHKEDHLAFFELGRVWAKSCDVPFEKKSLSGIFFWLQAKSRFL